MMIIATWFGYQINLLLHGCGNGNNNSYVAVCGPSVNSVKKRRLKSKGRMRSSLVECFYFGGGGGRKLMWNFV